MNAPAEPIDMIFVTGASRSGTTLLCRVLGNNARVLQLNELQMFGELIAIDSAAEGQTAHQLERISAMMLARQARDFWVDGPNNVELEQARRLVAGLAEGQHTGAGVFAATLRHLCAQAGKQIACEQTPRNIFYMQRLLELYPQARCIHMVRDPRAVLASQKNRWQIKRLGGDNVPWSEVLRMWFNYHPHTMSRLWMRANEAALALEDHPRVRLQRFEDLATHPQAEVRKLCDWLGLEYAEQMLDVPQWGSSNVEGSDGAAGVSALMVDKWREVLSSGEVAISERQTGVLMERFAYPKSTGPGLSFGAIMQMLVRYPLHVVGAVLVNPRRVLIQLKAILRSTGAPR